MAAMLQRNNRNGKLGVTTDLPNKEPIVCVCCRCSYTLCYSDTENYFSGVESNLETMRLLATSAVSKEHPDHFTRTRIWKGCDHGWLVADSPRCQRAEWRYAKRPAS